MAAPPFDFVTSKVRAPAVPAGSVPRIGLVNRLRTTRSSPLVVVAAPAGYGKTTLLAQWSIRDERPFAWVSIDSRDNDPVILLRHIGAALGRVGPLDAAVLSALRSPGRTVWSAAVPRVAAAIAGMERQFVLVLDGVDLLESQESLDAVTTLAEQIPEGSILVLTGRTQPRLGIARLRAGERLFEIGPEVLAFSRRDAHLLLRTAGLELTETEVEGLVARTEGWPAGLYLAGLALRGRGVGEVGRAAITGRDRYVAEYLRSELLSDLDSGARAFLMRSSVLGKMCGSLCDFVLETKGSGARLESLYKSNMLLVSLDDQCQWYRYHHLLEELLRHELAEGGADEVAALSRRAADWYEAHGDPESALEHAAESGDVARVARLFGSVALRAYHTGQLAAVESWLDYFPNDTQVASYPVVAVFGSWVHALGGRPAVADRWLRATEAGPDQGSLPDGSASARPWLAVVRSAMCRGGVVQMRADAKGALIGLPEDSPLRPAALAMHGAAHVLVGDAEQGDPILALAADEAMRLGATDSRVVALSERSLVAAARGDQGGADALAFEARAVVTEHCLDDYPTTALAVALCARGRLRQGRWDEARADLTKAHRLSQSLLDALPWLAVQVQLEIARGHVALRQADAASAILTQIGEILGGRPSLGVLANQAEALRDQIDALPTTDRNPSGLTSAELRVLPLLQTHLSFREIGERQYVSRNTIKTQAISIYRKLGVSSRSSAIERAAELGLIDSGPYPTSTASAATRATPAEKRHIQRTSASAGCSRAEGVPSSGRIRTG